MTNRFPFLTFGDLRGHVGEIRNVRVFCAQNVSLVDTVTYSTSLNQTKPSKIKHFLTTEVIGSDGNKCDVAYISKNKMICEKLYKNNPSEAINFSCTQKIMIM